MLPDLQPLTLRKPSHIPLNELPMNTQPDQLIFQEKQTGLRIFAVVMIIMGFIMYWAIGPEGSPMLIFVIVGLVCLVIASDLTIIADHPSQMLTLEYRSIFKLTRKEIPFAEISAIDMERSTTVHKHRRHTVYRIAVTLRDGQIVPFRSTFQRGGADEKQRQVDALRAFILG